MAGELISIGIQNLLNVLSYEHELFHGVKDQVTALQTSLRKLKAFMKDAEVKKRTDATVKNCLADIQEIIFDAEDIIETFNLKDQLGKNGGIKNRIRRFARIIPERRKIALEIGNLSTRISNVNGEMVIYGVQQTNADVRDSQPLQLRQEFAREHESNLVGLEENVKKLVGYLVEKEDFQVVSVTGMGGLGKTTLARQAFNHEMVTKKFNRLAWVCVTQVCDRKKVWQALLENFRPNEEAKKISEMTEATLQDELFRLLETSKFLIVLDDIWKEGDWDLIKPIFPHKTGSKVLITSRNESVAGRGEGKTYTNFKPECLSDQDSWTLFQRIAMPMKDAAEFTEVDEKMEKMGKQMIKHCGGLPLAVSALGGLLEGNYAVHYWKGISKNIGSRLVDDNSFNCVLSLSYEELPGYLKYCFLYLAHFPEDYEINVEDLSYFWAAEGILTYNDGETIRDAGDRCIKELVRRNMVISERDNITRRFETCSLHDLMRDLCLSKAKEENFLQIAGISSPTELSQSLSKSRRFVTQHPTTLHVNREINNSKVRSLVVVWKKIEWRDFWGLSGLNFTRLQLLRVLHSPGAKFKGEKLPYSIGKLIHLRYLNLEDARVYHLPSSLQNLKLLIYLNLKVDIYGYCTKKRRVDGYRSMQNFLREMKELRYLALPRHMREKTKLELSHLVNLETLVNFATKNGSLEDLRGMARLRTLGIILIGETSLENLSASIGALRHLENLSIDYTGAKGMIEWRTLLEFIDLKQLTLSIKRPLLSDQPQFPSRLTTLLSDQPQFPSRLTSLSLWHSELEEDPMLILEKFVQLKEVNFGNGSFRGRKMVCSGGGFPQLQKLSFSWLNEWEEWIIEEGSMPLLHTLEIDQCCHLKELPDGLRFISSLKNLSFGGFMGTEWREKLSEGGEDYHKVQHIPFVRI